MRTLTPPTRTRRTLLVPLALVLVLARVGLAGRSRRGWARSTAGAYIDGGTYGFGTPPTTSAPWTPSSRMPASGSRSCTGASSGTGAAAAAISRFGVTWPRGSALRGWIPHDQLLELMGPGQAAARSTRPTSSCSTSSTGPTTPTSASGPARPRRRAIRSWCASTTR